MEALERPPTSASIAGSILSGDVAAGAAASSVDAAPPADSAPPSPRVLRDERVWAQDKANMK